MQNNAIFYPAYEPSSEGPEDSTTDLTKEAVGTRTQLNRNVES